MLITDYFYIKTKFGISKEIENVLLTIIPSIFVKHDLIGLCVHTEIDDIYEIIEKYHDNFLKAKIIYNVFFIKNQNIIRNVEYRYTNTFSIETIDIENWYGKNESLRVKYKKLKKNCDFLVVVPRFSFSEIQNPNEKIIFCKKTSFDELKTKIVCLIHDWGIQNSDVYINLKYNFDYIIHIYKFKNHVFMYAERPFVRWGKDNPVSLSNMYPPINYDNTIEYEKANLNDSLSVIGITNGVAVGELLFWSDDIQNRLEKTREKKILIVWSFTPKIIEILKFITGIIIVASDTVMSHSKIIFNQLGIVCVGALEISYNNYSNKKIATIWGEVNEGDLVQVDGDDGLVKFKSISVKKNARSQLEKIMYINNELKYLCSYSAESLNEIRCDVLPITKVGLFKFENFLKKEGLDESIIGDAKYDYIKKLFSERIKALSRNIDRVNVRLIDYDKKSNDYAGFRGVRNYALDNNRILYNQIDILKYAMVCNKNREIDISIVIPLISAPEEILFYVNSIRDMLGVELRDTKVEIGIMVETISCLYAIEDYGSYIDFLVLGPNDITQSYFLLNRDISHEYSEKLFKSNLLKNDPFKKFDDNLFNLILDKIDLFRIKYKKEVYFSVSTYMTEAQIKSLFDRAIVIIGNTKTLVEILWESHRI